MPAEQVLPEQETGIASDTIETIELPNHELAREFFTRLRQCMLDVDSWEKFSGESSASFKLMNPLGAPKKGLPEIGDHFRISIPAPKTDKGDGYDWVRVEKLEEGRDDKEDIFIMQVRPSPNPHTSHSDEEVAHFFTDAATSSFIVRRTNNIVSAEVHGRNEKPNTGSTAIGDKIRISIVVFGAMAGFSKFQCINIVIGLVAAAESL